MDDPLPAWFREVDEGDQEASRRALLELVRWFDSTLSFAEPTSTGVQVLTRAIAAAGRVLAHHERFGDGHPVWRTLAAADAYVHEPNEETHQRYQDAATGSYPYGAGDGCYRVPELAGSGDGTCVRGSGCRTGAGSLYQIAYVVGASAVVAAIKSEL